jgi:hypothetical protein
MGHLPEDEVGDKVTRLGLHLLSGADALAAAMTERIQAAVPVYRSGAVVSEEELTRTNFEHVHFIFTSIGHRPDVSAHESRANGRRRAKAGMPLSSVMEAYRVAAHYLWESLADAATRQRMPAEVLVRAAGDLWLVQDSFTQAMAEGYREELTEQILTQERQHAALIQALLEGTLDDKTNLWEAAEILRLPHSGPYAVVVASMGQAGSHGLSQIETLLRTAGIASAWQLLHDQQTGIACLRDPRIHLDTLAEILDRRSGGVPVGVSPCYDNLQDTPAALRLARIAVRSSTGGHGVVLFDRAPLAIAAVSDPEVMGRIAQTTLAGLAGLPDRDRRVLLDTFGVWLDTGSANAAAKRLFCHPNTVRHRLRRLEACTGRSLDEPRWVAELGLAFEIDRRTDRGGVPKQSG